MEITEIMESMAYGPATESAAAATLWLAQNPVMTHFIGGEFVTASETRAVYNPATEAVLAQVALGSAAEVDAAVQAARAAAAPWAALPPHQRATYLYAITRQIQKRERLLAVLETLDNGKPIRESRDIDLPLVIRHFYHHAGWSATLQAEFPDHAPLGVIGQIIPWNFPLLMLAWKVAPALAAGNTVVLKPADLTPLTAFAFAQICAEVGLPAGVVNIVMGGAETGAALASHPQIDKIAFTGSTDVGREIRRKTAGSGKALSMELGGKSPFIVLEDADLDAAVEGVVDGIWLNQGEVCCAGSRILLQEGIAERFLTKLRARMARLRVGDPLDKCTDIGALASPKQAARVAGLLAEGAAAGAVLERAETPLPARGAFCAPSFIRQPTDALLATEIFGPVATVQSFRSPEEAISLANHSRYGLAASVWSEGISHAMAVASSLKAGVVWINSANLFDASAPFGGMRESGFGREGGRAGMADYLRAAKRPQRALPADAAGEPAADPIDITMKLYIGGKQTRPDSGQSTPIYAPSGALLGHAPEASRKDIRNAVEAAQKAGGWAAVSAHSRAQVLYFLAENLAPRRAEFAQILAGSGASGGEVEASIEAAFFYAGLADKYEGAVTAPKPQHLAVSLPMPQGVIGMVAPQTTPLLGLMALILPAIAMGNRVVAVVSEERPLIVQRLIQLLECSDLPAGVVNLLCGPREALAQTLAAHDDVDAVWYCGAGLKAVEEAACGNLKPVWQPDPLTQGRHFLAQATRLKTVWLPYSAG